MIYKFISFFFIHSNLELEKEWDLFLCTDQEEYELEIWITYDNLSEYSLEIFEDQPGKPVLKSNDSILSVNLDT